MKRLGIVAFLAVGLVLAWAASGAASVSLFMDSAPNVYGSPNWADWWDQTKQDVAAHPSPPFVNLRTGTFPGTDWIDPYDEIVYSTGDLGKRLHWIYWVPDETTTTLDGRFQVRWIIDWEGQDYTYDWDNYELTTDLEKGWVQPSKWEDYDADNDTNPDGVIGSFGFAWWATDDDAPPSDTNGNPYDETNQDDIDALRELVLANQTYALGQVRMRDDENSPWQIVVELQANVIPEPASVIVWGLLGAVAFTGSWLVRRRKA